MKELDPRLKEIGKALKNARDERSMTQEHMGKKLHVSHSTVVRYEKGEIDMPLSKLLLYADICDRNARIDLTKKTNGMEELMRILETEIRKSKIQPSESELELIISDKIRDYIHSYEILAEDPRISKKTLKYMKNDIINVVIEENNCDKDMMIRRVAAYAKAFFQKKKIDKIS